MRPISRRGSKGESPVAAVGAAHGLAAQVIRHRGAIMPRGGGDALSAREAAEHRIEGAGLRISAFATIAEGLTACRTTIAIQAARNGSGSETSTRSHTTRAGIAGISNTSTRGSANSAQAIV